ncbi:unnamed protein product, partial [Owenia fusiformis]
MSSSRSKLPLPPIERKQEESKNSSANFESIQLLEQSNVTRTRHTIAETPQAPPPPMTTKKKKGKSKKKGSSSYGMESVNISDELQVNDELATNLRGTYEMLGEDPIQTKDDKSDLFAEIRNRQGVPVSRDQQNESLGRLGSQQYGASRDQEHYGASVRLARSTTVKVERTQIGSMLEPDDVLRDIKAGNLNSLGHFRARRSYHPVGMTSSDILKEKLNEQTFPIHLAQGNILETSILKDVAQMDLSGLDNLTDLFFYSLASLDLTSSWTKYMNKISLRGCGNITDYGVHVMTKQFSELHTLVLSGCKKVTSEGVFYMMQNTNKLVNLRLVATSVSALPLINKSSDAYKNVNIDITGCPMLNMKPQKNSEMGQVLQLANVKERETYFSLQKPQESSLDVKVVFVNMEKAPVSRASTYLQNGKKDNLQTPLHYFTHQMKQANCH